MPETVRKAADAQLIEIHRAAVTGATDRVHQGAKPTVEGVAGGTAAAAGGCLVFRPAPFTPQGAPTELRVTLPPAGLIVTADGGPVAIGMRRFADEYKPVGRVATGASGVLRIAPDRAVQPWHLRVSPTERARVCGLA
jgi:hypothetical protein